MGCSKRSMKKVQNLLKLLKNKKVTLRLKSKNLKFWYWKRMRIISQMIKAI